MRIRSIKPEFWTSEDVAALGWDERLIYIGLWSYVDDNGVGRDVPKLIAASLFPLEDNPRETLARLSRSLARLAEAGRIVRYTVAGKDYLEVVNWDRHQRIDRPNKARFPRSTCENAQIRETLATPSRHPRESPVPGAVEQGNRGTGDSATRRDDARAEQTSQTLVAEWIDHCTERPPSRVIGQLSREVKTLLDEGIPYDVLRSAVAAWHRKSLHPSSLASVVHELRNPRTANGNGTQRPTTDQRVMDAVELARRLAAEEGNPLNPALEIGA